MVRERRKDRIDRIVKGIIDGVYNSYEDIVRDEGIDLRYVRALLREIYLDMGYMPKLGGSRGKGVEEGFERVKNCLIAKLK